MIKCSKRTKSSVRPSLVANEVVNEIVLDSRVLSLMQADHNSQNASNNLVTTLVVAAKNHHRLS